MELVAHDLNENQRKNYFSEIIQGVLNKTPEVMEIVEQISRDQTSLVGCFGYWLLYKTRTIFCPNDMIWVARAKEKYGDDWTYLMDLAKTVSLQEAMRRKPDSWNKEDLFHWGLVGHWPQTLLCSEMQATLEADWIFNSIPPSAEGSSSVVYAPFMYMVIASTEIRDGLVGQVQPPDWKPAPDHRELVGNAILQCMKLRLIKVHREKVSEFRSVLRSWLNVSDNDGWWGAKSEAALFSNYDEAAYPIDQLQEMEWSELAAKELAERRAPLGNAGAAHAGAWCHYMIQAVPTFSNWRDDAHTFSSFASDVQKYAIFKKLTRLKNTGQLNGRLDRIFSKSCDSRLKHPVNIFSYFPEFSKK